MIEEVMKEINQVMALVDSNQLASLMSYYTKDKKIFVSGAGRSGFQAKGFAMRLMHLGYQSYVMGESITPPLHSGDLFVAISGSGTTKKVLMEAEAAKKKGLMVLAVTSVKDSSLAQLADAVLIVPGATKNGEGAVHSIQLLSSLFDQTLHITLDILCLMLSNRDNISKEDVYNGHVNIE